jgi:hypothetical protein
MDLEVELPFGTLRAHFSNGCLCCRAIPQYFGCRNSTVRKSDVHTITVRLVT